MDLFEHYDIIPDELKKIIDKYILLEELTYSECEQFLKEVEEIGYTFDYGLDGVPYDLTQIKKG